MSEKENKDLWVKLSKVDAALNRVLFLLESDDATKTKGLVETVNDVKKSVEEMQVNSKITKAKNTVYGGVGGAIIAGLIWVLQEFFKNKFG